MKDESYRKRTGLLLVPAKRQGEAIVEFICDSVTYPCASYIAGAVVDRNTVAYAPYCISVL